MEVPEIPPGRLHSGISFLDLPRELRDMIYTHIPENNGVFTYDIRVRRRELLWKNDHVGGPKNGRYFEEQYANHGVGFGTGRHRHAILLTCRSIYAEALPILYAATPLGVWRPMCEYGGKDKYFNFTTKLFESLPLYAGKHIRTLQLQGELWERSMHTLMAATEKYLPSLKTVEIALDPYYDSHKRRTWFDEPEAKQLWTALAVLAFPARELECINIVFAPPQDVVYIWQAEAKGVWLSGTRYTKFIWRYLQLLALQLELTIWSARMLYGACSAKAHALGMMTYRESLACLANRKAAAEDYLADIESLSLENERDWLREETGRVVSEMNEKKNWISTESLKDVSKRWCRITYSASPRGFADPEGLLSS